MKWVVDNIEQFKGNPEQITLGGLVDGGAYVAMHMVLPASKGMIFVRSGSCNLIFFCNCIDKL